MRLRVAQLSSRDGIEITKVIGLSFVGITVRLNSFPIPDLINSQFWFWNKKSSIVSDKAKYIGSESDEEIPSLTAQKIKTKNISKRDTLSDNEEISSLTTQKIKIKNLSRKSTLFDKAEYLVSESDEEISSLTVKKIKTKNISRKSMQKIINPSIRALFNLKLMWILDNLSRLYFEFIHISIYVIQTYQTSIQFDLYCPSLAISIWRHNYWCNTV